MIQCQLCDFSNSDSILSHVRVTHGLSSKEYKTKFPNSPLRKSWMRNNEIALSQFREVGHANKERRNGKVGHHKLNDGQWSKNYEKCLICSKTDSKHIGHGICKKCLSLKQQLQKTRLKNEKLSSCGIEGEDFVICKECGKPFECLMTNGHLKMHNMTEKSYQEKHGENSTRPSNLVSRTGNSVSIGRHKLMAERGYLNSQSMRDNKRVEMIKVMSIAQTSKTSSIENDVEKWLLEHNFSIQFFNNPQQVNSDQQIAYRQFPFLGKYVVDFAIPTQKIIIEVLGTFWHGWSFVSGKTTFDCLSEAAKKNVCTDKVRFVDIIEAGWTYIELWEHDIKDGKTDSILSSKIVYSDNVNLCCEISSKLVSAKPIANTPRKLYNFRWHARQNNITILSGLLVTQKEFEILKPLVLADGENRSIPESVISEYYEKINKEGFPYYDLTPDSMLKKWDALKNNNVTQQTNGCYFWDGFGTDLASIFHPHLFECRKNGKLTPLEFFSQKELMQEAIYKVLCLYGTVNRSKIREICRNDYKSSRINNFPPKVAITVARLLLKENIRNSRVLDPCAGFGGRLLGFSAAGVKSYTGIDLSKKTFGGLQKETDFLKSCGASTEIEVINGDCICEMTNMIEAGKKFDLIMTSPPFKDKEEYVGVPFYTNMKKWTDEFVEPFLKKAFMLIENGGFLALYLGRTEKDLEQLPKVVDSIAESLDFIKCEPINFLTAVGESSRNQQHTRTTFVGVWKKDSPPLIVKYKID